MGIDDDFGVEAVIYVHQEKQHCRLGNSMP
jgi:hypothetical protein